MTHRQLLTNKYQSQLLESTRKSKPMPNPIIVGVKKQGHGPVSKHKPAADADDATVPVNSEPSKSHSKHLEQDSPIHINYIGSSGASSYGKMFGTLENFRLEQAVLPKYHKTKVNSVELRKKLDGVYANDIVTAHEHEMGTVRGPKPVQPVPVTSNWGPMPFSAPAFVHNPDTLRYTMPLKQVERVEPDHPTAFVGSVPSFASHRTATPISIDNPATPPLLSPVKGHRKHDSRKHGVKKHKGPGQVPLHRNPAHLARRPLDSNSVQGKHVSDSSKPLKQPLAGKPKVLSARRRKHFPIERPKRKTLTQKSKAHTTTTVDKARRHPSLEKEPPPPVPTAPPPPKQISPPPVVQYVFKKKTTSNPWASQMRSTFASIAANLNKNGESVTVMNVSTKLDSNSNPGQKPANSWNLAPPNLATQLPKKTVKEATIELINRAVSKYASPAPPAGKYLPFGPNNGRKMKVQEVEEFPEWLRKVLPAVVELKESSDSRTTSTTKSRVTTIQDRSSQNSPLIVLVRLSNFGSTYALLDTALSFSLITQELTERLKMTKLISPQLGLRVIYSLSPMIDPIKYPDVVGVIHDVSIRVGSSKAIIMNLYVVKDAQCDCVLGVDFVRISKAIISMHDDVISFDGGNVRSHFLTPNQVQIMGSRTARHVRIFTP